MQLCFKKPGNCKPFWQEDFTVWGRGLVFCLFVVLLKFFVPPSLPEKAFVILLSPFLSLPIPCRCHSLTDLIFIVKLTSSQVYSDQVVIETNGLALHVTSAKQFILTSLL